MSRQTLRHIHRARLFWAVLAATSIAAVGSFETVVAQRSREAAAALTRFLEDAAARGIAEQDITRAVFEGRLNPEYRDLELVREALAREGDPFPAASGGREWIRRFGSIGALHNVRTVVNGVEVVWSGRDILAHAAITGTRISSIGNVSDKYPQLRALPDSWRMGFDEIAAHLQQDTKTLAEFTADVEKLDGFTNAVLYFSYTDGRSPDGKATAGPFDARLDYDTLRKAKYLRELAGQSHLPLDRALTASERAARVPLLSLEPWSYKHGVGFGISDQMRAREAAALGSRTLTLELLIAPLNAAVGGAQSGAVDALLAAARRADAEKILKTLPGWTEARLKDYDFASYQNQAFLDAIMRGDFEPSLGRQPEGPNGLKDRPRGWYLDLAFGLYHNAFGLQCRSVKADWIEWTTWIETTRVGPFGPTGPPTVEGKTSMWIREPFFRPVTIRAKLGRMSSTAFATDILRATQTGELQKMRTLGSDYERFLKTAGCTSDVAKQFEVNLFLLAEGFPSLRVLLPGVDLLGERALRPRPMTAAPPPAMRSGEPSGRGVVAAPPRTSMPARAPDRPAPTATAPPPMPAEAVPPARPAEAETTIANLTSPTEGELTGLDLAGRSLTLRLRDRGVIVRFWFDDTTTVSALDGSARQLVRSEGKALDNVRTIRLQWVADPSAPSRPLIGRITITAR